MWPVDMTQVVNVYLGDLVEHHTILRQPLSLLW